MRTSTTHNFVEPPRGVQLVHQDGTAIVMLRGEIDLTHRDELQTALAEAIQAKSVTVDLSGTTFIDSTALNALIRAHRAAHTAEVRMTVTSGPDNVMKTLRVSGVEQLLANDGQPVAG